MNNKNWLALAALMGLTSAPVSAGIVADDGYYYAALDMADGSVAYNFTDIAATGTPVRLSDDDVQTVPLGFDFDYYGQAYSEIDISSNGFLAFESDGEDGCCSGDSIPSASTPNGVISAWWSDLNPGMAPIISYEVQGVAPDRVFIVQYDGVPDYDNGAPNTYQYKLFENGAIELHYQEISAQSDTSTIGIESPDGTMGVEYFYGSDEFFTGITPMPWAIRFQAMVNFEPLNGYQTSEFGDSVEFEATLGSAPAAEVTIPLSVDNPAEGVVTPASITFGPDNWSTPQVVTVSGVDDATVDGNVGYKLVLGAATSTDPNYNGWDRADVDLVNADNDAPGVAVSTTRALSVTEGGESASFSVRLNTLPADDVIVDVSSGLGCLVTEPASLTFTAVNGTEPQLVNVSCPEDQTDWGVRSATVSFTVSSTDTNYNGTSVSDLSFSYEDNDQAGVIVTSEENLFTTESGGSATFSVQLASQPVGEVTVAAESPDAGEFGVSPVSLVFDATNWDVAQVFTVTGVDDSVQDSDVSALFQLGCANANGADIAYAGSCNASVEVTNRDDDTPFLRLSDADALLVSESGTSATFRIELASAPTDDVVVSLTSESAGEVAVSPETLTFTAADWSTPQEVAVIGVDDDAIDGAQTVYIDADTASADAAYDGMYSLVQVVNADDDTAGLTVAPAGTLRTSEAGGAAAFSVVLNSRPLADVTFDVVSSDTTEATLSVEQLVFTSSDWNVAHEVTVTGADDGDVDGDAGYKVMLLPANSDDPDYSGTYLSIDGINTDNETAGAGITVSPSQLFTTEDGGTADLSVVLNTPPLANVTFDLVSLDTTEAALSSSQLVFTPENWNQPQTVTVTGVDDGAVDGDVAYRMMLLPAISDDAYYSGQYAVVDGVNSDNDTNDDTDSGSGGGGGGAFGLGALLGLTTVSLIRRRRR